MPHAVGGALLAAGRSLRMGRPKPLLPGPGGRTFAAGLVETLRAGGLSEVMLVGRPDDEELRRHVQSLSPPVRYVENRRAAAGQVTSIQAALEEAQRLGAAGLLVLPVDIPLVRPETVTAAVDAFSSGRAPIVRVTHRARHGHPVVFGAAVFEALRQADPAVGAKAVLAACAEEVLDVEVDDPGVLRDVDDPQEYRALFGRDP